MIRETFSLVEAGQILGIGRSTAYELARKGRLPVLRLGRKLVVPKVALDKMLNGVTPDAPVESDD